MGKEEDFNYAILITSRSCDLNTVSVSHMLFFTLILSYLFTLVNIFEHLQQITTVVFVCVCVRACSVMSDSVTPWTIAHQASLSMGFSRQEYWSGMPFPIPGTLPDPGTESTYFFISCIDRHIFTTASPEKSTFLFIFWLKLIQVFPHKMAIIYLKT